jgi:hypothetical protein
MQVKSKNVNDGQMWYILYSGKKVNLSLIKTRYALKYSTKCFLVE